MESEINILSPAQLEEPCRFAEKEKKKQGRPNKSGIEYGWKEKQYYNEYHHLKNEQLICECGAPLKKFAMTEHKKRKTHTNKMKKLLTVTFPL